MERPTQWFEQETRFMKQVDDPTNPDLADVVGTLAAPVTYEFRASSDEKVETLIRRINIVYHGSNILPGKFGGGSALGNGIKLQICDANNNVVKVYPENLAGWNTIKTNADWARLAGRDAEPVTGSGVLGAVYVRWTLVKGPGIFWLAPGFAVQALVQDDLTGTTPLTMNVQGTNINNQAGQVATD